MQISMDEHRETIELYYGLSAQGGWHMLSCMCLLFTEDSRPSPPQLLREHHQVYLEKYILY